MPDYLSVGRTLQKYLLQRRSELQQEWRAAVTAGPLQLPEHDFLQALFQCYRHGNHTYLTRYLKSGRPITAVHCELLAQAIEGGLDRPTKRGRPPHSKTRQAAWEARVIYSIWRGENKKARVKDHGCSSAMKDEVVRFVVEELYPQPPRLKATVIRNLMDRPKSRRGEALSPSN